MQQGFNLGVIEGFYGKPWSWQTREQYSDFLLEQGYGAYIYGPKFDLKLREEWQKPWTVQEFNHLKQLATCYQQAGLKFGIALSPYEVYQRWNQNTRQALTIKMAEINAIGADILCILFDDMRGDVPELAINQGEICDFIAQQSQAQEIIMCPTYYSDDPVLERIFGAKPDDYLEDLGQQLDAKFDVFWTGPSVWSVSYPPEHLIRVADQLGRKPVIWDNYPVNDMKNWHFLFLRAFQDRLASMPDLTRGHFVNPMNQPQLSKVALHTLPRLYAEGDQYEPNLALRQALSELAPTELAKQLLNDVATFADRGFKQLSDAEVTALKARYDQFNHPMAQEVLGWLNKEFEFDANKTQLWSQD
ncbi:beta-N-acetylglucosaminidase domain-containing protein [Motilimonas sp. 1_MG-2023]|uniref:beta-N-acetylglucosaminidase domain-containing protein n=1 Tax=Motilimonas sp. 1_MG-2023 TaxID=3062672 RepID=UPI0026E295FD|nr:beta-N-acetylglucosaminidase domain-containing protein [Motilimonas sp. 1_MG-2023]MDO6524303.1 beta-N-acetylglucosaminidase domain-containing protein [Motilimonas sp. 1_MG-2023]